MYTFRYETRQQQQNFREKFKSESYQDSAQVQRLFALPSCSWFADFHSCRSLEEHRNLQCTARIYWERSGKNLHRLPEIMVRKDIFISSDSGYWEGRTVHFLLQQSIVITSKAVDYGHSKNLCLNDFCFCTIFSDIYISVRWPLSLANPSLQALQNLSKQK